MINMPNQPAVKLLCAASVLMLSACKVIQITPEGGYIESASGAHNCPAASRCEIDVENGSTFNETFTAIANPGYVFSGWKEADKFLCGNSTAPCALLNVPALLTNQDIDLMLEPVFEPDNSSTNDPRAYFEANVAGPVIDDICTACHIDGGAASISGLFFVDGSSASAIDGSYNALLEYLQSGASHPETILNKVRGGLLHGGGSPLPSNSSGYQSLSTFVQLVAECDSCNNGNTDDIFDGIRMASPKETLRRATLLIAGRLPSEDELAAVEGASDSDLHAAVVAVMEGQGFHNFLTRSANDRLLTDAFFGGSAGVELRPANIAHPQYPVIANTVSDATGDDITQEWPEWFGRWYDSMFYAMARAPLELIAYVVENDRPYTEILTADYTLQNSALAEVYRSNLSFDSDRYNDFKPGVNQGQILIDEGFNSIETTGGGSRVLGHSGFVDYPIAGLLNTSSFLSRYPTTETNRNRARSRWTYYHFLGVDIEKSASRTTDPEALADTNNPTMNNPACIACHEVMDPVAGTFQNYGIDSYYKESWGGRDSLPEQYKYPDDGGSLYHDGDTWFRDMRASGIGNAIAPSATEPLQWLAQQITEDQRFATATVRFWWPALMKADALSAPGSSSDRFYNEKLRAFEAQSETIEQLASDFRSAYKLKTLLADMVVSPWFRASSSSTSLDESRQAELENLGARALLTPAELNTKISALTGYRWGQWGDPDESTRLDGSIHNSELTDRLAVYYGGIDSFTITERARQLNSIMTNVAQRQANQMACHSTVLDFERPDSERLLFAGVDRNVAPTSEFYDEHLIEAEGYANRSVYSASHSIAAGDKALLISFINSAWDEELENGTNIMLDRLEIKNAGGEVVYSLELENALSSGGGSISYWEWEGDSGPDGDVGWNESTEQQDHFVIWGWQGQLRLPLNLSNDGEYTVELTAWGRHVSSLETPLLSLAIESLSTDSSSGAERIKQSLAHLHLQLLGEELSPDSAEIQHSYDLLVDLWELRKQDSGSNEWMQIEGEGECNIPINDFWNVDRWETFYDPQRMMGTWSDMLVYFMTDHKFLHE